MNSESEEACVLCESKFNRIVDHICGKPMCEECIYVIMAVHRNRLFCF